MNRREALKLAFAGMAAWPRPLRSLVRSNEDVRAHERFAYYINSREGDDRRDGRSPATAKRTLASISSFKLSPSVSIGFARGSMWNEHLLFSQSGLRGSPILLGAYGPGANPVFDASAKKSWSPADRGGRQWITASVDDPQMVIIGDDLGERVRSLSSVRTDGQWFWDSELKRLYVGWAHDPVDTVRVPARSHAITLKGCSHVTLRALDWRGAALDGLMVEDETKGITIDRCLGELCVANGAFFPGLDSPHHDGTITGSTFRNNGASGLLVNGDFQNFVIADSFFHHNALLAIEHSDRHTWTAGLKLWGNRKFGAGSVVERCVVHDNGCGLEDGARGLGIWIDQAVGVNVRYNTVFRNDSSGIYLEKTRNSLAHHNVVWHCAQRARYSAGLSVKCSESDDSIENGVYNNVVYDSGYWGLYVGTYQAMGACRIDRTHVANNIIFKARLQVLYCDTGADNDGKCGSGNEYTNNCFGEESTDFLFWRGQTLSSYAALEHAYGAAMHNVRGDPGCVDAAKGDFQLTANSPCRKHGASVRAIAETLTGRNPDVGRF